MSARRSGDREYAQEADAGGREVVKDGGAVRSEEAGLTAVRWFLITNRLFGWGIHLVGNDSSTIAQLVCECS
jgi:hypothetical protein